MLGSCVAVSAALLPQQLADLKQHRHTPAVGTVTPLLITHGSQDLELPRATVEATVAAAKQLGMDCWTANAAGYHAACQAEYDHRCMYDDLTLLSRSVVV